MSEPIYIHVTTSVADYADAEKQKLLELGCSEEYAERRKQDVLARAVQVRNSFESNSIQSGRVKGGQ